MKYYCYAYVTSSNNVKFILTNFFQISSQAKPKNYTPSNRLFDYKMNKNEINIWFFFIIVIKSVSRKNQCNKLATYHLIKNRYNYNSSSIPSYEFNWIQNLLTFFWKKNKYKWKIKQHRWVIGFEKNIWYLYRNKKIIMLKADQRPDKKTNWKKF